MGLRGGQLILSGHSGEVFDECHVMMCLALARFAARRDLDLDLLQHYFSPDHSFVRDSIYILSLHSRY